VSTAARPSLRDYDAARYGPFLGVSDGGDAASAIRAAALSSPKAQALADARTPLAVGIAHDAERLRSVGEVPVGPVQYERIRRELAGDVLITTNVGSHVNLWHYRQPPTFEASQQTTLEQVAAWAAAHRRAGEAPHANVPWLRIRFQPRTSRQHTLELLHGATQQAPIALALHAQEGRGVILQAIDHAAATGARAVVIDGAALPPSEGRPALPGLLNYFDPPTTRELLRRAHQRGIQIEPALKIDTDSVANQIWTGLDAARANGLALGKYGLFPLTFPDIAAVVGKVQQWTADWTAAPAFYLDVPWVDGHRVYDISQAAAATSRWIELVAEQGATVVLIDTVDKGLGRRLVRTNHDGEQGILSWEQIEQLQQQAADVGVRVLWAGGISIAQLRDLARRGAFGVYVTTAASQPAPLDAEASLDIGLTSVKRPVQEKIALVKLLLDAGFLDDPGLDADVSLAEAGEPEAAARLHDRLVAIWRERLQTDARSSDSVTGG
jgi:hypothetical protein